jgi:hypothetical protein
MNFGGAVCVAGAGATSPPVSFLGCTFNHNSAGVSLGYPYAGGAVFVWSGNTHVGADCTFHGGEGVKYDDVGRCPGGGSCSAANAAVTFDCPIGMSGASIKMVADDFKSDDLPPKSDAKVAKCAPAPAPPSGPTPPPGPVHPTPAPAPPAPIPAQFATTTVVYHERAAGFPQDLAEHNAGGALGTLFFLLVDMVCVIVFVGALPDMFRVCLFVCLIRVFCVCLGHTLSHKVFVTDLNVCMRCRRERIIPHHRVRVIPRPRW